MYLVSSSTVIGRRYGQLDDMLQVSSSALPADPDALLEVVDLCDTLRRRYGAMWAVMFLLSSLMVSDLFLNALSLQEPQR